MPHLRVPYFPLSLLISPTWLLYKLDIPIRRVLSSLFCFSPSYLFSTQVFSLLNLWTFLVTTTLVIIRALPLRSLTSLLRKRSRSGTVTTRLIPRKAWSDPHNWRRKVEWRWKLAPSTTETTHAPFRKESRRRREEVVVHKPRWQSRDGRFHPVTIP